ncbi:hypothetical protein [Arthrobacter psychrolactophilus]
MKSTLSILWLLSRPAPGSKAVMVLPAVAFALVTALLLIVLAGALSFFTNPAADDPTGMVGVYQMLAAFALSLMVFPMMTLGGSAARLSARRRDERLSTLRLLGGTPALVSVLTIIESTLVAVVGIAAGIVLYAAALPAIALIHFQGQALGLATLWLPAGVLLIAVAALILLAAISAALGLRLVILSPLGPYPSKGAHRALAPCGTGCGSRRRTVFAHDRSDGQRICRHHDRGPVCCLRWRAGAAEPHGPLCDEVGGHA